MQAKKECHENYSILPQLSAVSSKVKEATMVFFHVTDLSVAEANTRNKFSTANY